MTSLTPSISVAATASPAAMHSNTPFGQPSERELNTPILTAVNSPAISLTCPAKRTPRSISNSRVKAAEIHMRHRADNRTSTAFRLSVVITIRHARKQRLVIFVRMQISNHARDKSLVIDLELFAPAVAVNLRRRLLDSVLDHMLPSAPRLSVSQSQTAPRHAEFAMNRGVRCTAQRSHVA